MLSARLNRLSRLASLSFSIVLLLPTPLRASEAFQTLLQQLDHHPAVQQLEAQARGQATAAQGAMGLPNPGITLGINNVPLSTPDRFDRFLPSNKSIAITQAIPNLTGRRAGRDMGLARAQSFDLKAQLKRAQLQQQLIITLAKRERIATSMRVINEQLRLIAELEGWFRGEMESGKAVYGKVELLDVDRGLLREKLLTLVGEDQQLKATQRLLVGRDNRVALPAQSSVDWQEQGPEPLMVQLARQQLQVAKQGVAKQEASLRPDYGVSGVWQQRSNDASFEGDDWYSLRATIKVPLWAEWNQKPKIAGTKQEAQQARFGIDAVRLKARAQYETARAAQRTAQQMQRAIKRRQIEISQLEEAMRRRYEAGEIGLEGVIKPAIKRVALGVDIARHHALEQIAVAKINGLFHSEIVLGSAP
uniref:Outer membrane efflux protein n=1 Tax=Magnetococcus massalia (strain MO-1) TaxID=451514 RepID=A0A1S7LJX4_MAGMO|nr:Conserved exported protein of unknown function [Candidatus Magnetococcus massalia]